MEKLKNVEQIENILKEALKSKESLKVEVLRSLKTRVQNEKIAKGRELGEEEILALVQSEVKRRKESVTLYEQGSRPELAEKEQAEIDILNVYLPAQASDLELEQAVEEIVSQNSFSTKDFGKAMGLLKSRFGNTADGSKLANILKEKLSS